MTEKRQKLKQLKNEILGLLGEIGSDDEEETVRIPEKVEDINQTEQEPTSIEKKKKPMTDKQKEALKRGQEIRLENAKKRKDTAEQIAQQKQKELEDKIVKKALSIKKKEIKQKMILDQISDDETEIPLEKIKKIVKQPEPIKKVETINKVEPPKIKYTFF